MRTRTRATEVDAAFLSARALARMSGLTERVTTSPALCWCDDGTHTGDYGPVISNAPPGYAHRVTLHTLTLTAATEEP